MGSAFALCAAAWFAQTPGYAQRTASDDRAPSDVVVTGRGIADPPGDRTFDVVGIDRQRIEANASARLENVLADVAGLQQFRRADSRSANPTSQGITLRGIGGNAASRALLILDGVPQTDPFGGWVAFPAYATDRLDRIRVTRGGGSGIYGAGALAGAVELDSAAPLAGQPLTGTLAYGSRDSTDARGTAALIRQGGFATLSGAYARGDGFIPTIAASRGPVDRSAPYEQASGAFRVVVGLAPRTELQATLSAFTDTRDRGTPFTANTSEGADASVRLVGRGRWGWSALAYVQTRAFASSFASIDPARTTATQTLDQYNTPATGLGARIEVVPPVGEGLSLRVGADIRDVSGRTQERYGFVAAQPTRRRVAGGTNRNGGLFVDGDATLGAVTASIGGRVDWWTIADGSLFETAIGGAAPLTDRRFADRSGTEATGRAGLSWTIAPPLTLRTAAYRGWRLPTLNELYRPFRVGADATAPDPALRPETLEGVEVGAALRPLAGIEIATTYFWNRLDDAIANVTAGRGPGTFPLVGFVGAGGTYRVRRNIDAATSQGLEVEAAWRVGPLGTRVSWTHLDPRIAASGVAAGLDGLRPAQTPRDQLSATVDYRRERWAAALTVRHLSGQFDDDQNLRRLDAATTLDASLALPLTRAVSLEARAENLADALVEAGTSGAGIAERATPRTVWIGLRYRPAGD